jgi:hypothetical protein
LIGKRIAAALVAAVLTLSAVRAGSTTEPKSEAPPATVDLNDQGTFKISFAGQPFGTEKFSIRSSPREVEAEAEIQLRFEQGGQGLNVKTNPRLVLNPQLNPLTYSLNQSGSQAFHLEVDFRTSPATSLLKLTDGQDDQRRDLALHGDIVILDDNVIHHYQLLVDRFAMKPGKKQTFNAYIPQEAVPGVLTVLEMKAEEVQLKGDKLTLRHLVVSTELAQIDLLVDAAQHLQRLYNPVMQLEAVREK